MTLEGLKKNIAKLISLYEGERQRADGLAERLAQSQEAVEACKTQIADLNRQIDTQKLKGAFMAEGGNAEARDRLNKLIREIDRCIALLEH
ncbi:MAG: hypothetical protein IJV01_00510 [Bacteroidales bacterium]|nr:hypothetical protein [Bacteroidales bacterium]